jgi:cystathionine gamma-synthase
VPRRTTFRFGGDRVRRTDTAGWAATERPLLTAVTAPPAGLPSRTADLVGQLDRCLRELHTLQRELDEQFARWRRAGLPVDDSVLSRLVDATRQAKRQLAGQQQQLLGATEPASTERLAVVEPVLRYGLATLAHVRGTLALCSPWPDGAPSDSATMRVARQVLDVFGLRPGTSSVSVTSTGMAAYALVEGFLLRERLYPGDTIVVTPHVDPVVLAQLESLRFVRTVTADGHSAEDILSATQRHHPRCVFVSPLADTAEQRMTDVPHALELLRGNIMGPLTVVVDGTAMSASLPPLLPGGIEVLYVERGAGLQLGVDAGVAGVVAYPERLRASFQRQLRAAGLAPHHTAAELFPQYTRDFYLARMLRIGTNAVRLAGLLHDDPRVRAVGTVHHPALPGHPDGDIAARLPYPSGHVTFTYDGGTWAGLADLVRRAAANGRLAGVDLTAGARIGSTPILCAVDGPRPFLLARVGDREDQVDVVAETLATTVAETRGA